MRLARQPRRSRFTPDLAAVTVLLSVALLTAAGGSTRNTGLELPPGVNPEQTFTFYDNGTYREATLSEITALIDEAASDPRTMLGAEWYRSPAYVARYFTMDLLGIADWRNVPWSQTAAGPGNAISDGAGVNLGIYLGPLIPDDENDTATVTLNTAGKTAYLIGLARAWPGGPWLVVSVAATEYVEGP